MTREEQVTAVAEAFGEVLRQWLTPAEFETMRERNATAERGVCHSHDFCDANVAMGAAFEGVLSREPDPASEEDAKLWGDAWDLAHKLYLLA